MSDRAGIFRLRFNWRKTVEAIDFLAQRWPGITQYYLGKVLYFADRDHCIDWGRTITGDRYVAMDHGPVPSRIYDMLKYGSGEEDEILDYLNVRVYFAVTGNKIHVQSYGKNEFPALSSTDIEYLERALAFCRRLAFSELREVSHKELSWRKATELPSNNPPMDLTLWFEAAAMDREAGAAYLREHARYGVN